MSINICIFYISLCVSLAYLVNEYIAYKTLSLNNNTHFFDKIVILSFPVLAYLSRVVLYSPEFGRGYVFHILHLSKLISLILTAVILANYKFAKSGKPFKVRRILVIVLIMCVLFIAELFIRFLGNYKFQLFNQVYISLIFWYVILFIGPIRILFYSNKMGKGNNFHFNILYWIALPIIFAGIMFDIAFYFKLINFPYFFDLALIISILILAIKNYLEYRLVENEIKKYFTNTFNNKNSLYESFNKKDKLNEIDVNKNSLLKSSINLWWIHTQVKDYTSRLESLITNRTSELQVYKKKYQKFYDNASFLYMTFDFDGNVIEVNKHAEILLKYDRTELLNKNILNFVKNNIEKEVLIDILNKSVRMENIEDLELTLLDKYNNEMIVHSQFAINETIYKRKKRMIDCVMKEVTHQKKLLQKNEIISNINKIVANKEDLDQLLLNYAKEITKDLNFNELAIRLLSGNPEQIFKVTRIVNKSNHSTDDEFSLTTFFTAPLKLKKYTRLFKNKGYLIFNSKTLNNVIPLLINESSKAGVIVLLVYGGDTKAVLEISSNEDCLWDKEDVDIIIKTAPTLSVVFEFLNLFRKISYSESRYKHIVESSYDAIIILDEFGNIRELNESTYSLLEWDKEKHGNIIGKNINRFLKEEIHFSLLRKNSKQSYRELKLITKKGNELTIDLNIVKSPTQGEIQIYCVVNDITEKYNQELQLIQTSKMATLGEMATSVAHELNQPLNNIGIIAQRFLKKIEKQEFDADFFHKRVNLLIGQINRASQIINHMREFGRKSEKNQEEILVNNAIDSIFTLISEQLNIRNIKINIDLTKNIPRIKANSNRLEQILLNLINNARDAMEDRDRKELSVRTYYDNLKVYIEVEDTGMGMDEKTKEKIFEPFFTTKEVGKGTGLGLSISYKLVRDYKGNIFVKTIQDKGTTFIIEFPRADVLNTA